MKKLIMLIALIVTATVTAMASMTFSNERLSYRVMYKWGLINKQAGTATLTFTDRGDHYAACLTAASAPWADRIYSVRDTLNGRIDKEGFLPLFYEKIAHEGGEYKHDTVRFSYSGSTVTGMCTRRVIKKGKESVNQQLTLTSIGTTVDMLSSFYYMRALPFEQWHQGQRETITIFSGKRKESLTLKYHGTVNLELDGKAYKCYHITFIFTGDGGKRTSDDMDAWITADNRRIPVQLEGKLPVGKVRCQLI
ncbi:MAG: DUF3108 domain-containing protein [Odoribacter sp.]|nr:DUF3108 domain-containing protein [Odoribacter sp.]